MSDFWIEDGETMLFIGDSITDCGRRGGDAPFGSGYVRFFTELATAEYPERNIRFINKGIGGNRVTN
ncbi:MAG: GDSL family lipase, partial [Candidatus Latescibacteria bacterium]|nr:GDSL family lipase [Candidatus Latescibacterota bacterium]